MDENNPYYQNTNLNAPTKKSASAGSIAAFVLGLISLGTCVFFINIPLAIISIVLAAISLAKKHGGKSFAISGIALSGVSLIISTIAIILISPLLKALPDLYSDLNRFIRDDAAVEEYDRTGNLPDYMDKYSEGEIGDFFDEYYDGFDKFLEDLPI